MPEGFFPGIIYIIQTYWVMFLSGVIVTIVIAVLGTLFGFLLGIVLALLRFLPHPKGTPWGWVFVVKLLDYFSRLYVQVFRGTPMIVQAMVIYYGVMELFDFSYWNPFLAGIVVVSLNTAAYMAEIIRGGILAIDPGQTEASYAVGMTYLQTMRYVIIPQAIKHSIPAMGNEFIVNLKDTAVLNVIAVTDLYFNARSITATHYRFFEVYVISSLLYLAMTLTSSYLLRKWERRLHLKTVITSPTSQTVPETMEVIDNDK